MSRIVPLAENSRDLATVNREFYDALWSQAYVQQPHRFNTWPLISSLLPSAPNRLELGPGLRPRLPIEGTHFIDISVPAIEQLNARGGLAVSGEITALPFRDRQFDLVAAFDVIEHIEDDRLVFHELSRVLKDDGVLIFSVPLYANQWTEFDDLVGHVRRYEPEDLRVTAVAYQFVIEKSAAFGMAPRNPRLLNLGMHWLMYHRKTPMCWYDLLFQPLVMFIKI